MIVGVFLFHDYTSLLWKKKNRKEEYWFMSAVGLAPLPASNAFSMKVGVLYCFFQTQTFGLWKSLRNAMRTF